MPWNVPRHARNRPKRKPKRKQGRKPYNGYADGVLRTNDEWKAIWWQFERERAGELGRLTLRSEDRAA
jgi:hypothetical protein